VAVDRAAMLAELIAAEGTLEELEQRLAEGETLQAVCLAWNVPRGRILSWLMADAKRYAAYERALEVAAHGFMAETVGIADAVEDKDEVPAARLQVDTRFRLAEKHAPEKYGRREEVRVAPILVVNASLERVADALLDRLSGRTIEQPRLAEEVEEGDV
jgi:hypothetical protein